MCKRIGLTPEQISLEDRFVAELAYANYLQINASRDDWFNAHAIMIACTYVAKIKSPGRYDVNFFPLRDGPKLQRSYMTKK